MQNLGGLKLSKTAVFFIPQHQAQKLAGALASNFFATMDVWETRLDPNILVEVVKVAKIQVCDRIFLMTVEDVNCILSV